ncbi:hypothetical protein SAMN05519104_0952 [Rhizobiales bacterium GAS188]|nr:hypothetical protein SAMN05519104_0952 [Rhizobiales bacterium GAS188]
MRPTLSMPDNVTPPPKPGRGAPRREIFSFDRAALVTLGFYEPGKTATLNDPAFTGARFPKAIVAHELMHQSLGINTTFGLFTQTIGTLRLRGLVGDDAFDTCHEVQWTVQEATATYAELAVVARTAPAELAREINALPTSREMQPPYREAFETIASWLPLDAGDDEATLNAKGLLVRFLGYAAMNTDCLRRGLADAPSDALLFDCMADTPDDRFARLLALGKDGVYVSLLDVVRRHKVDAGDTAAEFSLRFCKLLRSLSEPAIAWEEEDLQEAAARLYAFWRPFLPNAELRPADKDPLPKVAFGSERAEAGLAQHPPQRLPEGAVAEFAAKATKLELGIIVELALAHGLVHARLGAYVPARQDEAWPAKEASEEQSAAIPPDITGLALPETLLRELDAFPTLPRVVSLLSPGGVQRLADVPGSEALFRRAIRVYRITNISVEDVEEAVREGGGREYLILRLSPTLFLGCILHRGAEAFVIARMASDVAVEIFVSICDTLGIGPAEDPDSLRRERCLLGMIGHF